MSTTPETTSTDLDGPDGMRWDPDTGRLEYEFWEAQREALEKLESGQYDIVAFLAGYRSGKSVTGARWILSNALRYSGTRYLAMGQDFEKAKSTTYRVLFEQLPGERTQMLTSSFNGPENSPIVADYNRNDKRLTLANDSVIQLGSADKWSRYAGDEYSAIWLDEPSHYGPELFDLREVLGTRLSADRGPRCMFWSLTGNGYNSAWRILEKREDSSGDPLGDRIELIRASVLNNPYVDAETKAKFRRQFEGTGREEQAMHGGFQSQEGLVYQVQRGVQIVGRDVFGDRLPPLDDEYRVYGYDAGFKDPRVVLELRRTVGDHDLVVVDEFYEKKTHVDEAIDWILERPDGVVLSEHEPEDIEDMEDEGIVAIPANKSHDAGIPEVRRRFNHADDDAGDLYVLDDVDATVRELFSYKEEDVGGSDVQDHAADALRYAVMGVKEGDDAGSFGLGTVDRR